MHLFKTEMLFLDPPRTRFAYGRRAPGLQRYGRRAPPHTGTATRLNPPARIDMDTIDAAPTVSVVVDRAA